MDRPAYPGGQPRRISALIAKVADRITMLVNNRRTLWSAFMWASLNWLLDAACLWVFIWSFGRVISPIDLLVAYGLANILAAIPITPAGLGIIEGVLIPTLVGFGVPHSPSDPRGAVLSPHQLLDPDSRGRDLLRLVDVAQGERARA